MHVGGHEGDVGANCADVGDVIVDAFQFEAGGPQGVGAWRRFNVCCAFDSVAKSSGMRETGIAGNAFGQPDAVCERKIFEKLFCALVDVEHSQLQIEDWFARDAKKEMPRLDGPGVNRADWHLKDAFALDGAEFMPPALERR